MKPQELIEKTLGNIASRIVQDQEGKGMRSSGRSADSLEVRMNEDGGELWGADYFYFQVFGRRPGKQPPIQSIEEWIEAKGIEPVGISVKSLAFLIARKIGRLGTNIFSGKVPGLAVPAIIELETIAMEKDLDEYFGKYIESTITAGLLTLFKKAA